jgi:hypothetical protein
VQPHLEIIDALSSLPPRSEKVPTARLGLTDVPRENRKTLVRARRFDDFTRKDTRRWVEVSIPRRFCFAFKVIRVLWRPSTANFPSKCHGEIPRQNTKTKFHGKIPRQNSTTKFFGTRPRHKFGPAKADQRTSRQSTRLVLLPCRPRSHWWRTSPCSYPPRSC